MIRSMLAVTTIVLGLTTCSHAQVELRWKIADNEKLSTTVQTNVQQMLSIAGQDLETKTEQKVVVSAAAGKRAPDGTIRRTTKIESLQASMSLPGGVEIEFDSAKPVEPLGTQYDMLLDLLEAVAKTNSTVVYGKDNRVTAMEVDRSAHEKLDDQVKALIKGRFDSDYLVEASNKELDQIPSTPVNVGDTWTVSKTVRLEAGQTLAFETAYKYEGTVETDGKKLDKISFAATEVSLAQENTDGPSRLTDSDLKIESADGTILFDRGLGRIVAQNDKVHINGDLNLSVNGQELEAKLDLTFEHKTTVQ